MRRDAQEAYNADLQRRMGRTVWNTGGCSSWYLDANGRNTTIWPDFTWRYWQQTRRFDPAPYMLSNGAAPERTAGAPLRQSPRDGRGAARAGARSPRAPRSTRDEPGDRDRHAQLVDIRSERQRAADGIVPGSVFIPRNVLEWRCDPASDHHDERLVPDRPIVLMCDEGYQSSLAAATLRDLGVDATDLAGGFQAWRAAGLPTEHSAAA